MQAPALSWSGAGYLDCNFGDEPLEAAFTRWDWSRTPVQVGTAVVYDIHRRDDSALGLALRFGADGSVDNFEIPPRADLTRTFWRVQRQARSEGMPVVIRTLEDTPFYARSLVGTTLFGERTIGVHESLSLDRVAHPIVRAMLPFRMPRWRARPR
jgi:carotenoid 1,2-hydratase